MPYARHLPFPGVVNERWYRIGGVTLCVRSGGPLPEPGHAPMAHFAVAPGVADMTIDIARARPVVPDDALLVFDSGAVWKLYERGTESFLSCSSPVVGDPYKVARIDAAFSHVHIDVDPSLPEDADALEFPLDEVLLMNLLGRGRGVELHACGLIDGARGYLFVGQSGAGKTTTARQWLAETDVTIVSDDRVVVRAEGEGFRLYGTPWHGEAALSSAASAPLEAVFLLAQRKENILRPLAPAEAAARLFACSFPLFHRPDALAFTVDTLAELAARVPVMELGFVPTPDVVGFVRESLLCPS